MRPARFPYLEHEGVLAFAHRGGAGDAPENTLPAFQACVDLGYRYVETDAHLTRDGVLVAFHDETIDRVTDRSGRISEMSWAELKQARVDGRASIPLLEDILGTWPELRVNIDPKHDAALAPLVAVIKRTECIDRVCIGAFSDARLRRARAALGPRLCTSLGPIATVRLRAASYGVPVGAFAQGCAQVPVKQGRVPVADGRFIREAHRRGLQVHVWTIDEPDEMRRLLDMGVDGLMTDRPEVLKEVLVSEGCW